jgi:hypothetical protein
MEAAFDALGLSLPQPLSQAIRRFPFYSILLSSSLLMLLTSFQHFLIAVTG